MSYHIQFNLKLCGEFQPLNAITAVEAVQCSGLPINGHDIETGLSQAFSPARCEVVSKNPVVLLDGAHNPDGLQALSQFIKNNIHGEVVAIMGMMADKDVKLALSKIVPCFKKVFFVSPDNPRALSADKLATIGAEYTTCTPCRSIEQALGFAQETKLPIVICGSFFLASEVRALLLGGK